MAGTPGNEGFHQFIVRIRWRVNVIDSGKHLRELLKEGYGANAERDLAVAAEWFPLEEEAWDRFENAARKPVKRMAQRSKRS